MATVYDKGIAYKNFNGDIWYRNFPNNSGTSSTGPLPGEPGWGCGVYPGDDLEDTLGLFPMEGCDNPKSDNYGNYQNTDGSVFVFIPKFYYSFNCQTTDTHYQDILTYSNLTAEQVAEIVRRSPLNYMVLAPSSAFKNEVEANEHGFILHRAFIDGGVEKSGFFISKYLASRGVNGDSNKALFVKNGKTISLCDTYAGNEYIPSSEMPNCTGIAKDAITLSKVINSNLNCASAFMQSALAMQSKFLGTVVTSIEQCAWYDNNLIINYPKGCNNGSLGDIDDSSVIYTIQHEGKPLTGSGTPFAKTTHNGLNCGVCDLNGCMYQVVTGVTWAGSVILKTTSKLSDITLDNVELNNDSSIYYVSASFNSNAFHWGSLLSSSSWRKGISGKDRDLEGIYPAPITGISMEGFDEFGKDSCEADDSKSALLFSGYWHSEADAGVFDRDSYGWTALGPIRNGFRAGGYAS